MAETIQIITLVAALAAAVTGPAVWLRLGSTQTAVKQALNERKECEERHGKVDDDHENRLRALER